MTQTPTHLIRPGVEWQVRALADAARDDAAQQDRQGQSEQAAYARGVEDVLWLILGDAPATPELASIHARYLDAVTQ